MNQLEGKTALVTGAGRGLGEAIVRTLHKEGATVLCADFREDLCAAVAESLNQSEGTARALCLDVRDEQQVRESVARSARDFGGIDILVNNAGTDVTCSIEELSVADWDRVIETNLRGPFLLSKELFPIMRERGGGSIVNIISTAAKRTWANACAYHSSKWGLLGMSHALHVEGRKENIKVTAIVTGGMRTPFLLDRFPDLDPAVLQDPQNVAQAVLFALLQPAETVIPELMVIPMRESSWP